MCGDENFRCEMAGEAEGAHRKVREVASHVPGSTSFTRGQNAGCCAALSIHASGDDSGHTQTRPNSTWHALNACPMNLPVWAHGVVDISLVTETGHACPFPQLKS